MVVVVAEGDTWALDLGGASEGWMVLCGSVACGSVAAIQKASMNGSKKTEAKSVLRLLPHPTNYAAARRCCSRQRADYLRRSDP